MGDGPSGTGIIDSGQEFIENPGKMTHTYNLCAVEAKGSSAAKYQHLYQFRTMAFMKEEGNPGEEKRREEKRREEKRREEREEKRREEKILNL
ncbi:hypothetical protein STEG23_015863 [Scotinomys teguina]